jgi:hypothetical protein
MHGTAGNNNLGASLQALIFAPTNTALGNTLAALNISNTNITPANATVLAETIFYHIVPSE